MKNYITKICNKENLSRDEIEAVMHQIMSGGAVEEEIKEFLLALNDKGPTVEEITGAAKLLQQFYTPVRTGHEVVLDTCGTGGDQKGTFNISTIVALVAAAAGGVVAKHGNRSVSSQCGSADVLEALGVNLDAGQDRLGECLDTIGIAFLFAQKLHPAMKNVAPARKALGVRTIFNILGPLINPAKATHQMMGVYSRDLVEPMARVLQNLGLRKALVVHGEDGMDEVTTTGKTFVAEYDGQNVITYDVNPRELGVAPAEPEDLRGGDLQTNVRITRDILEGKDGPKRDIVLVNTAYALYTAEKVASIAEGMQLAAQTVDAGKAKEKLQQLIDFTNR